MVTVKECHLRQGKDDKEFVSLELMGEIELVQSSKTGRFYATARRCFVSSTFDIVTANRMVGKEMPGSIAKMECEPYDYTLPETGEVIQLSHTYGYIPEQQSSPKQIREMV